MNSESLDQHALESIVSDIPADPNSLRVDQLLHYVRIFAHLRRYNDACTWLTHALGRSQISPNELMLSAELIREMGQVYWLSVVNRRMTESAQPQFELFFCSIQPVALAMLQLRQDLMDPSRAGSESESAYRAAVLGELEVAHFAYLEICRANKKPELYFNLGLVAFVLAKFVKRHDLFSSAILSLQYYVITCPSDPLGLLWLARVIEHAPEYLRPKEMALDLLYAEAARIDRALDSSDQTTRYIAPTNWTLAQYYALPSVLSKLQRLEPQCFRRVVCYVMDLDPQFLQLQSVWSQYLEFRTMSLESSHQLETHRTGADLIVSFAGQSGPLDQFSTAIEESWARQLPECTVGSDGAPAKTALLYFTENQNQDLYPDWRYRLRTASSATYQPLIGKLTEKGFQVVRLPCADLLSQLQHCSLVVSSDPFLVGLARFFDKPTLCVNASIPMGYYSPGQLILPRLVWSGSTQKNVAFKDYPDIANKLLEESTLQTQTVNKDYQIRDNSPQDMLEGLEQILSADFMQTATSNQIGSDFLRRHARIF